MFSNSVLGSIRKEEAQYIYIYIYIYRARESEGCVYLTMQGAAGMVLASGAGIATGCSGWRSSCFSRDSFQGPIAEQTVLQRSPMEEPD